MPLLWERVDSLLHFHTLLFYSKPSNQRQPQSGTTKAAKTTQPPKASVQEDPTIQNPPKYPARVNFTRFNIYAPWVKHLEVCPGDYHLNPNDSDLLQRYSTTQVLLPNLRSITSTGFVTLPDISRVTPFLSPSVVSLEFVIKRPALLPELSISATSFLLRALAYSCPNLHTLAVIPSSKRVAASEATSKLLEYTTDNEGNAEIDEYLKLKLVPYLTMIQPLVSFTTSTDILDKSCVRVISSWPSLERLEIVVIPCKDYVFPELAESVFPSLNYLALYRIPNFAMFEMFWNIPRLVGKLKSVKIIPLAGFFDIKESNDEDDDSWYAINPQRMLAFLAQQSPSLQYIWIRTLDSDAIRTTLAVPLLTLDVLRQLPLRTLHLEGIWLNGEVDVMKYLTTTFPKLQELGLPNHSIQFTDLLEFQSKMPELR
ncbi:hypothetical protein FRC07_002872, partial [Ceratobasidium sp. 392]